MDDTSNPRTGLGRLLALLQARNRQAIAEDRAGLTVAGEHFVHLVAPSIVALHCPVDQKVLLMEISPDIYFETDQHIGEDILLVRLDRISDEELSLRLDDAWTFRAPESLKHGR